MKLPTCIICDRALISDVTKVHARGQRTLVWSSTQRHDGKFSKVLDKPIQLHISCRKKYIKERVIAKAARKNIVVCSVESDHEDEETTVDMCTQSETKKCLICDHPLSSDVANVFERGQRKLVWASTKRHDGKFQKVLDKPVQLHISCRSKYIIKSDIAKAARENLVVCPVESVRLEGDYDYSILHHSFKNYIKARAAKPAERDNVQVRYVETVPIERDHEEEEASMDFCNTSEAKIFDSSVESFTECVEIATINKDPKVEDNIIMGSIKSEEENSNSTKVGINQSSGLPEGMPFTNNQCYTEIEAEKIYSGEQNVLSTEVVTENVKSTINSNSIEQNYSCFDYQKQCFICTGDASDDIMQEEIKKPTKKRVFIFKVAKRCTGDNVLCHCLNNDDNWSKEVRARVENKDLIALNARYHKTCYVKFLTFGRTKIHRGKKGRPLCEEIQNKMQPVFDFIDNYTQDGTEFSIDEMKRVLNVDLNSRTMKYKIAKRYGKTVDVGLPNNIIKMRKLVENNDGSISIVPEPEDSATVAAGAATAQHSGYRCNVCLEDIIGFRYACVQCADWDLCGACDARGEHATHYVLRIPANKPPVEVQAILDNIRNILLRDGGNSSEPAVKVEEGEPAPEPQLCPEAEEDPLAAPPDGPCPRPRDDCEEQTQTIEESMTTHSDEMELCEIEDATMFSILTEPISKHCGVALYTQQVKLGSEKAPYSQVKTEPTKERQMTSYSQVNTGHSSGQSQEAFYSRLKTKHESGESEKPSYSHVMTIPLNKEGLHPSYICFKTRSNANETKPTMELELWPWSGEQSQEISHSGVGSESSVQAASSYMEPNERLRKTRIKRRRSRTDSAAGSRLATYSRRGRPCAQGDAEMCEPAPSTGKRKSILEQYLLKP